MFQKFSHLLILQSPWRAACVDSDGLLKQPLEFPVNVSALCSPRWLRAPALSLFLQGVGVTLHHVGPRLPLAVLHPSPLYPCVSTLWWFSLGEGSRPGVNHHTTRGHNPLRGRLFWVLGGPESLKRSVLRSACWEEGGYSWWQRVRVGHLS